MLVCTYSASTMFVTYGIPSFYELLRKFALALIGLHIVSVNIQLYYNGIC